MDFVSPRFSGDPTLEEILDDLDTGTRKLAKHSPANAVRAVQKALLDLHWVEIQRQPQVLLLSQFVDGDYGPWTTETVLAYKRHYDIHFPPNAPTGTYDGFAGPATLRSLDRHCALLDDATSAITARADELVGAGVPLELAPPDGVGRTTRPLRGSAAAEWSATVGQDVGALVCTPELGTYALHGPVYVAWVEHMFAVETGEAIGSIGFPRSDVLTTDTAATATFECGTIVHDLASGVTTIDVNPECSRLRHDTEF